MSKMGRPKGENNLEFVCTIRLDEVTLRRLEDYCKKVEKQKSEVIRSAIMKLTDEGSRIIE